MTWATSKEYIQLVAKTDGWVVIPPGTRETSFASAEYKQVAPFSSFVEDAINHSNPTGQTKNPRPYTGAQYVGIPQFQAIGTNVGQTVSATLAGSETVDAALASARPSPTYCLTSGSLFAGSRFSFAAPNWERLCSRDRQAC